MSDSSSQHNPSQRSPRECQVDALIAEYYAAAERGESPDQAEFLAQHAEFAAELREFFANMGVLKPVASKEGASLAETRDVLQVDLRSREGDDVAAPDSWQPGLLVAQRYRVLHLLGRGGMGEVYLAEDRLLRKQVALKVLREQFLADAPELRTLLREADLAQQVTHGNVCRVFDLGLAAGRPFLSMEFIEGQTLDRLLKQAGSLTPHRAAEIAGQICAGLQAAHEKKVLHRDLKPGNVLVDAAGKVYLTDFGLACLADEEQPTSGGTLNYMSPEQLEGAEPTIASDIYALGLILFDLYTGRRLLAADSLALARGQRRDLQVATEPEFYTLEPAVRETIVACLEYDPSDRPGSAAQVSRMLLRRLASLEDIARKSSDRSWSSRQAAACFAAVVAGLGIIAWLSDSMTSLGVTNPKNIAVLEDDARKLLRDWGFPAPRDTAAGFTPSNVEPVAGHSAEAGELLFWYRESPELLVANHFFPIDFTLWPYFMLGRVSRENPAPAVPGMVEVVFDGQGQLLFLRALPDNSPATMPGASTVDWQPLLTQVPGLETADLSLAKVADPPPVQHDAVATWSTGDNQTHVTLASYRGRLVYFLKASHPNRAADSASSGTSVSAQSRLWGQSHGTLLYLAILLAAVVVAVRNIVQGYCDHRHSLRVALAAFGLALAGNYLSATHVWSASELDVLETGLSMALYLGFVAWVSYVATEPFVRRHLPDAFISWGRLLTGRWNDPAIGRDLLLGILLAVGGIGLSEIILSRCGVSPLWTGGCICLSGLQHPAAMLGQVLVLASFSTAFCLLMLISLVVGRRLLGSWGARTLFVLLWTLPFVTPVSSPLALAVTVLITAGTMTVGVLMLERYGFLPLVVSAVANAILLGPITAQGRWYAGTSAFLLLSLGALAAYGAWSSVRGAGQKQGYPVRS